MSQSPYLYSKTGTLKITRTDRVVSLDLQIAAEELSEILKALKLINQGSEFKLVLPEFLAEPLPVKEEWTVYFKRSDFAHKAMCSHPTVNEWVGSIIVPEHVWAEFLASLEKSLSEKSEWHFEQLGRLGFPNNLRFGISPV